MRYAIWISTLCTASTVLTAQAPVRRQTDADAYTRYELLAPGTAKFRIIYEVFPDQAVVYVLRFWHGARGEPEIKAGE